VPCCDGNLLLLDAEFVAKQKKKEKKATPDKSAV